MKTKILVIGANSNLAKAVIPVLAKDNTVITAGKSGCDVYCNVTKDVSIPSGTDVVINFAASFGGNSDKEMLEAFNTNVLGTLNICKSAKAAAVKHVINISTIFTVLDNTSPSYSIYAMTKKQADELAQLYCGLNHIPLTILRPSRIYGDSDGFRKNQPFFYQLIDKAKKGEAISIYGKNDAHRNYIHCADIAEIISNIVTQHIEGVYACTHPDDVTYSQIAQIAQKIFNRGGTVSFLDDKPDIPDDSFEADSIIYDKINYWPVISMEDGIRRIKAYRERVSP
jgi:nucleoside-diphosphate-sugar epimerase